MGSCGVPDIVLSCGQALLVDDEDYDYVASRHWYIRRRQDRATTVIHDEYKAGRRFRVFLHRAVAMRVKPGWAPLSHYVTVRAKNGDYCDVRRANLQIVLQEKSRGRKRHKPQGWLAETRSWYGTGATVRDIDIHIDASPLWTGGIVKTRTRAGIDGKRQHVVTYAGRIVVGEDGRCRGDFLGDYERQQRSRFRRRGDAEGDPPVQLLGEDEGG
jgi:hypothetical protein